MVENDLMQQMQALQNFCSGLSHSLRTPLSVLKNDLLYFEKKLGAQEVERSKRRCQELVDTIDSLLSLSTFEPEEVPVTEVLGENLQSLIDTTDAPRMIGIVSALKHGFRLVEDGLDRLALLESVSITINQSTECVLLRMKATMQQEATEKHRSELLSTAFMQHSHIFAIADLIFTAHRMKSSVEFAQRSCVISFSIPLCDAEKYPSC